MLRDLLRKAQSIAEKHLPEGVRETSRKLIEQVQERAAALGGRSEARPEPPADEAALQDEPLDRSDPIVVVVFGYPGDAATDRVCAVFTAEGAPFRRMNLHDQPQAARQIAGVTGVMAPPYVYVRGRFWGGEGEIDGLRALGELHTVVAGDLAGLSDEARRIGKLREEFDDGLSAENIVFRLRRGHILTLDDLDCWFEPGPEGQGRLFYEGAPRPADELEQVAAEIAARHAAGDLRAVWRFEPAVSI
ncbi:hypothetical protein [Nannocystis punicea]|uniref:Glutaredoxin n=1 Tax=Nannocystis punicea TaxID=2995304 RepID=A0ABY7HJF3_9BACT|nr:hypothetical protein [Nannocystis poenicansa]WAS99480.1 hypothetical protein O0S08_25425 [Nannocystis poenicansa]